MIGSQRYTINYIDILASPVGRPLNLWCCRSVGAQDKSEGLPDDSKIEEQMADFVLIFACFSFLILNKFTYYRFKKYSNAAILEEMVII